MLIDTTKLTSSQINETFKGKNSIKLEWISLLSDSLVYMHCIKFSELSYYQILIFAKFKISIFKSFINAKLSWWNK